VKVFLLVVSLWGFNGSTWVYTGNQMVLQEKFETLQVCQEFGRQFMKFEMNKYFTFKVQCIEDLNKAI
jgi:urocanate hydratase